jgi:hypothetical protein
MWQEKGGIKIKKIKSKHTSKKKIQTAPTNWHAE